MREREEIHLVYDLLRIMDLKNKKKRKEKLTRRKDCGIGFSCIAVQGFGVVGN